MERALVKRAVRAALILACVSVASGCGRSSVIPQPLQEEGDVVPIPALTPEEKAELEAFREPEMTVQEVSEVLSNYGHLDPKRLIPTGLLKKAVLYFDANKGRIPNGRVLTVVDFSPRSSSGRMFIVDMKSGAVMKLHVAHGQGSDRDNDGWATSFGNVPGSNKSSLGFYRTAETYYGKHGLSLRMDGLSSTNSKVRDRAIVVHSAKYVKDEAVKQGRSNGCLAVSDAHRKQVVNLLKNGSIIYAGLSGKT